jgi:hypothetical protein
MAKTNASKNATLGHMLTVSRSCERSAAKMPWHRGAVTEMFARGVVAPADQQKDARFYKLIE